MHEGLYESLVTEQLERDLGSQPHLDSIVKPVDRAEQPDMLARHVKDAVHRVLSATSDPDPRVALVNALLAQLAQVDDTVAGPPQQLRSLTARSAPGTPPLASLRPATPLSEAALLTNARDEPSLGAELRAELDSADEVDLLCAFVRWHGLRVLAPELERLRARGVGLRVITTTYIGATERAAIDRLVSDFGARVRVQYDALRTRLHAKAWLFRRNTTFDTAYVGSSNLSRSALLDGVEWNVRLSRIATPSLLEKFRATFDTYWNDPSFEQYDPERDRDRLDDALAEASGRRTHDRVTVSLSGLEVRPYQHQAEM